MVVQIDYFIVIESRCRNSRRESALSYVWKQMDKVLQRNARNADDNAENNSEDLYSDASGIESHESDENVRSEHSRVTFDAVRCE